MMSCCLNWISRCCGKTQDSDGATNSLINSPSKKGATPSERQRVEEIRKRDLKVDQERSEAPLEWSREGFIPQSLSPRLQGLAHPVPVYPKSGLDL